MTEYAAESRTQYNHMMTLARAAAEICLHGAIMDPAQFPPIPRHLTLDMVEPGGGIPVRIDAVRAFTAAFYAPVYGPASQGTYFRQYEPLLSARESWSNSITGSFNRSARSPVFRRLFFNQGLWQVFLDPEDPEGSSYRARFEAGDATLRKDRGLLALIENIRTDCFQRDHLPHKASHGDAMRFANTVLHIDEQLGWTGGDLTAKTQLLADNLPEMRRLALWNINEANLATSFMADVRNPVFLREYLSVDSDKQKVGFDLDTIQQELIRREPASVEYARRGCPALALRTMYQGKRMRLFAVMDQTIIRMFQTTGALRHLELRYLPHPRPLRQGPPRD